MLRLKTRTIRPPSERRRAWSRIAAGWATVAMLGLAQGSVAVPQALAATPPGATTGGAQQVDFASATVTGTVNPQGSATTYYFDFGTSAGYGTQTSATSAGSGTADLAVQRPLSGLSPSTTYHYRLVAVSAGGTVPGHDATFVTAKTPAPTATTDAATSVTSGAATLNGSVNPDGAPTTYYFDYGTTAGYGTKTATQSAGSGTAAQAASAAITGLGANTTYHYRVVSASAGGTVVGGDVTFTTAKTPAPVVATGSASRVSTTTAVLAATVNPQGVATSYSFQYGTTSGYGHSTPTASAGSGSASAALSATLGGLAPGTTYHYRAVAVSAGGTVAGRDATFATSRTPSPAVTTGAVSAVSLTTATLNGTIDPHGVTTHYYFEYGTKSPSTRTATVSAGAGTATLSVSAALSRLVPGTTYLYRLVAVGASTVRGSTRSFTAAKIAPALALRSAANPVAAGASVTFTATLSGTGVGVRTVALEVEPYPYTGGFRQLGAPKLSSASGTVSFSLANVTVHTIVRAVTVGGSPALVSAAIRERAFVRVSLHLRRNGRAARFFGSLRPGGTPVQIQLQRRVRGRWVTIVRTGTHRVSARLAAYSRTLARPHPGRYRVLAHVRNGSLLSSRSVVVIVS